MFLAISPLPSMPMARKEAAERTQQINFRLKTATVERMERFKESHPLHPTLTQIVEAAIAEWLGKQPHAPARPADKPKK